MFDILKKEWKLSLSKWLLAVGIAMAASFVLGNIFIFLVMKMDWDNTFIYLGTFIGLYSFSGILILFINNLFNIRFPLLVSLGQKRSSVVKYMIFTTCGIGFVMYMASVILYMAEKNLYPALYPQRILDNEITLSALPDIGWIIFLVAAVAFFSIYVLAMKFGDKVFGISVLTLIAACFILSKAIEVGVKPVNKVLMIVLQFLKTVTKIQWITTGIIVCVVMLVFGYYVIKRHDVKCG